MTQEELDALMSGDIDDLGSSSDEHDSEDLELSLDGYDSWKDEQLTGY